MDFDDAKDQRVVLTLLVAAVMVVMVRNAWVCDDAYITFRSIENLLSGYGPTFNVGERVQSFTHPLWMFLNAGLYALTSRVVGISLWALIYYQVVLVSLFVALLAVSLLAFKIAQSTLSAGLALTVLIFSKAFIDYTSSGLENPLTYLLLVLFMLVYFRYPANTRRRLLILSLLACLSSLNRADTLLLFIPALFYAFWRSRDRLKALGTVVLGFTPLILWELFSLFYYGFFLPNTAYAKLNTGIPLSLLLQQGYAYFLNSLSLDPLTLLVILFALGFIFSAREWRFLPFGAGILLYLVYILRIGGDFMSGRYFAAPLLMATGLLSLYRFSDPKALLFTLGTVVIIGFASPRPPVLFTENLGEFLHSADTLSNLIDSKGISDEHLYYHDRLGLLRENRDDAFPGSRFAGKKWMRSDRKPRLETIGPLGVFGYLQGPDVHVIDLNGLADPLMARLPIQDPKHWRIGHFRHIIPEGYLETLKTGENVIVDPNLARYYDKLKLITRGDLFSWERLKAILNMNLGRYDHWIRAYLRAREVSVMVDQ